jgi:hypothetical protein
MFLCLLRIRNASSTVKSMASLSLTSSPRLQSTACSRSCKRSSRPPGRRNAQSLHRVVAASLGPTVMVDPGFVNCCGCRCRAFRQCDAARPESALTAFNPLDHAAIVNSKKAGGYEIGYTFLGRMTNSGIRVRDIWVEGAQYRDAFLSIL